MAELEEIAKERRRKKLEYQKAYKKGVVRALKRKVKKRRAKG